MVAYLRHLVVLATSLASINLVFAAYNPAKTNSTPCKQMVYGEASPKDWIFLTRLRTPNSGSRLQVASGQGTTKQGVNCNFEVNFGYNPFANYDQIDQRVTCSQPINEDFRISYEAQTSTYRDFWSTLRGGSSRCDSFSGNFNIDATKVRSVTVYQKLRSTAGHGAFNADDPSGHGVFNGDDPSGNF